MQVEEGDKTCCVWAGGPYERQEQNILEYSSFNYPYAEPHTPQFYSENILPAELSPGQKYGRKFASLIPQGSQQQQCSVLTYLVRLDMGYVANIWLTFSENREEFCICHTLYLCQVIAKLSLNSRPSWAHSSIHTGRPSIQNSSEIKYIMSKLQMEI